MATFRPGNRSGMPDHNHSAAAMRAFTGNSVGNSSNGGAGDGSGAHDDAPVCRQTTVCVSSQAAKKGSHCPEKMDGKPRAEGNSGKLTALNPRSALLRTSAVASATSANQGSCNGMIRSG